MARKMQKIVVSGILLNSQGEILLAQRPLYKKIAPGAYHLPGGHVEFGETAEQALKREIFEELNLDITVGEIVRSFSYIVGNTHTIGITFKIYLKNIPKKIQFDAKDTKSIVWAKEKDLESYLKSSDHDYITIMSLWA